VLYTNELSQQLMQYERRVAELLALALIRGYALKEVVNSCNASGWSFVYYLVSSCFPSPPHTHTAHHIVMMSYSSDALPTQLAKA